MDQSTREMLVENGVAPMQGIHEALECHFLPQFGISVAVKAILKNGIEKFSIKPLSGISTAGNVSTLVR